MIGSLSSRCSRASQAERAFALQPGILGVGVALRQWAAGVTEALITVNARTVLLEDVMAVFDSSRMKRLDSEEKKKTHKNTKTGGESLFCGNKNGSKFTAGKHYACNPYGLLLRG